MRAYIADRQSGKTTMLIKESARTGATIAVATYKMVEYVSGMAKQIGLEIPTPVIYRDMFRDSLGNTDKRYLVDELQMMLSQMNIDICTLDKATAIHTQRSTGDIKDLHAHVDKNGNLLRNLKKIITPKSIKEDVAQVFKVSFTDSSHIYTFNDIRTLEDVAIGHTGDETESNRLAIIAGNMRFGDFFATESCSIYCENNETNTTVAR